MRRHDEAREEDGAATTALVLILPVVLLSLMVAVQLALAYHARQVVTAAAQDAALAQTAAGAGPDAGRSTAQREIERAGSGLVHDVGITVSGDPDRVHVEVTATVASVVPGMSFDVSGVADTPVERLRPESGS